MRFLFPGLASLTILVMGLSPVMADWPAFRGPQGIGASDENGLPTKWTATENVAWKTALPGKGCSTPIVSGERVFVTCFTGVKGADIRRHLVCVDRLTGKILWQKDVAAAQPENDYARHLLQHGFATSSPVTDGERVYVFYGRTGVLAYDFSGKELWRAEVGTYRNTFGSGSSPTLYKDLLLINASVESGAMLALDRATGKQVWKTKFQDDCWTTPLLVEVPGGRTEVVLNAARGLIAFDPAKGTILWTCECPEPDYVSASPVVRAGIVYAMGAGSNGRSFLAVRAGGEGDVTKTHVVWRQKVGASYCSPVLVGDYLYFFSDQATALRAKDGEVVFQERLAGLGREYGSPVAADGKIYLFTRSGVGHVLAASGEFQAMAENDLGDRGGFKASPAISHGQIFVRSETHLYCLQAKQ